MVKSFFVRRDDSDPGVPLDLAKHPGLWSLLDEVAGHLPTRPVQKVYMTPGTDLAVMERGGLLKQLRGKSERCLILGAGVLDGMRIRHLKGVLAHEYGHFVNEDTAGGGFSFAVRRSLFALAIGLARGGAATWYNPAWLFVYGFHWVFTRISHGASRLQEVLADRWAAFTYGSEAFERGLVHVIGRSVRFNAHAGASLKEVVENRRPLPNLYVYRPSSPVEEGELSSAIEAELNAKPSPLDSHPSPSDRIAWVRRLQAAGRPATPDDQAEAWSLFSDRAELEREMTKEIRDGLLVNQGIAISAEGTDQAEPEAKAEAADAASVS
jgi:Zn-dependent protease with chaperone function